MPLLVLAKDNIHWVDSETGEEFALEPCWPRPIPVGERLPEGDREVLMFCYGTWFLGRQRDSRWLDEEGETCQPTHWLPLPPDPE